MADQDRFVQTLLSINRKWARKCAAVGPKLDVINDRAAERFKALRMEARREGDDDDASIRRVQREVRLWHARRDHEVMRDYLDGLFDGPSAKDEDGKEQAEAAFLELEGVLGAVVGCTKAGFVLPRLKAPELTAAFDAAMGGGHSAALDLVRTDDGALKAVVTLESHDLCMLCRAAAFRQDSCGNCLEFRIRTKDRGGSCYMVQGPGKPWVPVEEAGEGERGCGGDVVTATHLNAYNDYPWNQRIPRPDGSKSIVPTHPFQTYSVYERTWPDAYVLERGLRVLQIYLKAQNATATTPQHTAPQTSPAKAEQATSCGAFATVSDST